MLKSNIQQKVILLLILSLAFFGTGLSCSSGGGSQQQSATLHFWKPFDSSDKWSDIIKAYNSINKNVKIVYTQKSPETYERDLLNAMAAGKGPDIFSVRNDWLPKYKDKISPMPEQMMLIRTFRDTFVDVVSDDFLVNNKIYGLPQSVDVLALYYNRDHLASVGIARPPSTWPELISMVPQLTQFNSSGEVEKSAVALGTANNINRSADILMLVMLQSGVNFYDSSYSRSTVAANARSGEESPPVRSVRFYTQFADPTSQVYTWNTQQKYSIDAFAQEEVSAIFGYSYLMPLLEAKNPFLDFGVTDAPQVSENQSKINIASYWAETVWVGSRYPQAAWDFINFATRYEQNKNYLTKVELPSSRRDVLEEQQRDPMLGVFADNVPSAQSVLKPDTEEFEKIINDLIEDVSLSGISPSQAVINLQEKINSRLENNPIR